MKRQVAIPLVIAGGLVIGGYLINTLIDSQDSHSITQTATISSIAGDQSATATHDQLDNRTRPSISAEPEQTVADPDEAWNGADYAQVLADTQIDGELQADENDNLVMSLAVKDFFDYFMSAIGEVTPEQAIEEIRKQAKLRVPEPAASQVMELLADYVTYQHLMQDFMQKPLVPADQQDYAYYARTLKEGLEQIKALRRQVFSPEAVEAFFGLDEAYSEYAVASMQIKADSALSNQQKETKLEELKRLLPEQMRIADIESRERSTAVQQARELWNRGQSEAVVRERLQAAFDEETINSTLTYFKKESAWNSKLENYLTQRAQILESGLSDQAKAAQVEQLRQSSFTQQSERMRAEAHERIEAENARIAALSKSVAESSAN